MEQYTSLQEVLLGKEPQTLSSKKDKRTDLDVVREPMRRRKGPISIRQRWLNTQYKKYYATIKKVHQHWKAIGVDTHLEEVILQLKALSEDKKEGK
jgi:hypothetical protein